MALSTVKAPARLYQSAPPPRRRSAISSEIEAIRAVFGDKCPPISATKALTGHSQGATGVPGDLFAADDAEWIYLGERA